MGFQSTAIILNTNYASAERGFKGCNWAIYNVTEG
jgi:hypothetical protein